MMNDTVLESVYRQRLLYCDTDCAVVLKLPGQICEHPPINTHSQAFLPFDWHNFFSGCGYISNIDDIHCVNRIDRPVSGAAVLAFSAQNAAFISRQFTENKAVHKCYWAIVEGSISDTNEHLLEQYLYFDRKKQKSYICDSSTPGAKHARLLWKCLGTGERYSFLEVRLLTGRTHQIRSQLFSLGFPIKGDVKYGARRKDSLPGIRLHARSVSFMPSASAGCITVTAPLPQTDSLWNAFLEAAGDK